MVYLGVMLLVREMWQQWFVYKQPAVSTAIVVWGSHGGGAHQVWNSGPGKFSGHRWFYHIHPRWPGSGWLPGHGGHQEEGQAVWRDAEGEGHVRGHLYYLAVTGYVRARTYEAKSVTSKGTVSGHNNTLLGVITGQLVITHKHRVKFGYNLVC